MDGYDIYYQNAKIASIDLSPILSAGTDEAFLIKAKYPLRCAWVLVIQSRFPVFYLCERVELDYNQMFAYLEDGKKLWIRPFGGGYPHEDSGYDKLLVDYVS